MLITQFLYTPTTKIIWHMSFICSLEHSVQVLLDSVKIYYLSLPELKHFFNVINMVNYTVDTVLRTVCNKN